MVHEHLIKYACTTPASPICDKSGHVVQSLLKTGGMEYYLLPQGSLSRNGHLAVGETSPLTHRSFMLLWILAGTMMITRVCDFASLGSQHRERK